MRLLRTVGLVAAALSSAVNAASQWTFDDGTLSVATKGSEAVKHKLTPNSPPSAPVSLTVSTTLKLTLTAKDGKTGKRPHQAFLTLHEKDTGLEESFVFTVKEDGKAKLDISRKDLPVQFLTSSSSLSASLVLASFGSSTPLNTQLFTVSITPDSATASQTSAPQRYTAKPEIHHIFKADPKSPPTIISLVFALAIIATLPALLGAWLLLGGNIAHAGKAFGTSPVAHGLFFGSIVAMEGVFFLYYSTWNLFQTLPAAAVMGVVAYVSGSKALTEVQERRLAGER